MTPLDQIAPAFQAMAHSIVWASIATVDAYGRPRTRILHPFWEWDGTDLIGWIATVPTPSEQFAVLRLDPYRLRVMPGTVMTEGEGAPLLWHRGDRP